MIVSIAHVALLNVAPDAFFELLDSSRFQSPCTEQSPMNILGTKASGRTDKDSVAILIPFQDGAGADAELSAHSGTRVTGLRQ
jgi:hypothetical protein